MDEETRIPVRIKLRILKYENEEAYEKGECAEVIESEEEMTVPVGLVEELLEETEA